MRDLAIRASWRSDLDELSALASRAERRGSVELLGVSDLSFAIAVAR